MLITKRASSGSSHGRTHGVATNSCCGEALTISLQLLLPRTIDTCIQEGTFRLYGSSTRFQVAKDSGVLSAQGLRGRFLPSSPCLATFRWENKNVPLFALSSGCVGQSKECRTLVVVPTLGGNRVSWLVSCYIKSATTACPGTRGLDYKLTGSR